MPDDSSPVSCYVVQRRRRAGADVIVLQDVCARTEVLIVPSLGNACVSFTAESADGTWRILAEPPDDVAFRERTTRYGVPILYPWPNRIRDGQFAFQGQAITIPRNSPGGHAIHGIVRHQPWRVDSLGVDANGAYVRCTVEVGGELDPVFPFRSTLTIEHRLHGHDLVIVASARNTGGQAMPMGFGLHPWFGLPFGPASSRGACEVRIPADGMWELDALIPTGRVLDAAGTDDLRQRQPLADRELDHVLTRLRLEDGWFTAEAHDPLSGRSILVRSDERFREHVAFAPHERDVLCLEPYTCTTDAFNLAARGIASGMLILPPGETWQGSVKITASMS